MSDFISRLFHRVTPHETPQAAALTPDPEPIEGVETACRRAGVEHLLPGEAWPEAWACLQRLQAPRNMQHTANPVAECRGMVQLPKTRGHAAVLPGIVAHDDRVYLHDDKLLQVVTVPFVDPHTPCEVEAFSIAGLQHAAPVTRDTTLVATCDSLKLLNVAGARFSHETPSFAPVRTLALAPDRLHALTGHDDGLRLWDLADLSLRTFMPTPGAVTHVAFSQDRVVAALESKFTHDNLLAFDWAGRLQAQGHLHSVLGLSMVEGRLMVQCSPRGVFLFDEQLRPEEHWDAINMHGSMIPGPQGWAANLFRCALPQEGKKVHPWPHARPALAVGYQNLVTGERHQGPGLTRDGDQIRAVGFAGHSRWLALHGQDDAGGYLRLVDTLDPFVLAAPKPVSWRKWLAGLLRGSRPKRATPPPLERLYATDFQHALLASCSGGIDGQPRTYDYRDKLTETLRRAPIADAMANLQHLASSLDLESPPKTCQEAYKLGVGMGLLFAACVKSSKYSLFVEPWVPNPAVNHLHIASLAQALYRQVSQSATIQSWLDQPREHMAADLDSSEVARLWLAKTQAHLEAQLEFRPDWHSTWINNTSNALDDNFWMGLYEGYCL